MSRAGGVGGELPRDGVYLKGFRKSCCVAEFLSPLKWSDIAGGSDCGERAFGVWFRLVWFLLGIGDVDVMAAAIYTFVWVE